MCGIAGWYRRGGRPVERSAIAAQSEAIRHRGPDDGGLLIDGDFGFGMQRLSILDIARGHQPMVTGDGRYAVIFNGEIFNHLEIRVPLMERGHRFHGHSDTETILVAHAAWGDAVWPMLEGMFSIAVWDKGERILKLVRDPLGIKPLYISEQNGGLSFASELKSLRVLPDHRFDVDDRAVHDVFGFGHVRRPRSIFRQVRTLEPGHVLTIKPSGEARTSQFWQPRLRRPTESLSTEAWTEQMRTMLVDTTLRHMQSDVPVGAFLSGGIDSSAILAAMTRASREPVTAFTIGYPGESVDETAAAGEIAAHLGCKHIVLPLKPGDASDVLPQILSGYDEPFADLAAIPNWHLSRLAAEHVKVVLCGEGGDELFAGYKRHRNARAIERARPLLRSIGALTGLIERWPEASSARINYFRQNAQRAAEFLRLPDGYQQFFAATQTSTKALRQRIYTPEFWEKQEGTGGYERLEKEYFPDCTRHGESALEQFLLADLSLNMPSAMLTRLDRASMAHSLEARVPFLSHKLVDWAMTVPTSLKLRGSTGKYILRQAIAPWVPPSVMSRPKQGFQIPHAKWLRGGFGDFAQATWLDSGAAQAGYLEPKAVADLFAEHKRGAANHARMIYAITVFSIWWRDTRPDRRVQA